MQNPNTISFSPFGSAHLGILAAAFVLSCVLLLWARNPRKHRRARRCALAIAATLLLNDAIYFVLGFRAAGGQTFLQEFLPLHLCGMSVYIISFAMITRRQLAFEIAFYWGLIGATQAILTPDIADPAYSYWSIQFFIRHCGILAGVAFLVSVGKMRPRKHSAWRAWGIMNLWLMVVALANWQFEGNYMYLRRLPDISHPLVKIPWPWYIVLAEALLLLGFVILERLACGKRRVRRA